MQTSLGRSQNFRNWVPFFFLGGAFGSPCFALLAIRLRLVSIPHRLSPKHRAESLTWVSASRICEQEHGRCMAAHADLQSEQQRRGTERNMKIASCAMAIVATATVILPLFCDAYAADRPVTTTRKSRMVPDEATDGLYMAARPEMFQGKAVRIYCERLRNPDTVAITCRTGAISIVVDMKYVSAEALHYAFENCHGMMSTCSGTVSGVAEFVRGVPRIVQADLEFVTDSQ